GWLLGFACGAPSHIFRLPHGLRRTLERLPRRLAALETGPLLGASGVVALAPAQVGFAADELLQLVQAVQYGLRPRWAARDVDVDRHELVGALDHGVVGEHAPGRRARSHRHHPLRLQHLVVDAADYGRHLDRDADREDQQIRLARRGPERLSPKAGDVVARGDQGDLLDGAAGEAEGKREDRVGSPPVEGALERRCEQPLLDVLLEVAILQVTPQQVACPQLPGPEALRLHFQSSAPRRQTKTRATSNSATKTRISPSSKTLFVRWTRTPTGYRKTTSMSNRMKIIAIM